MAWNGHSPDIVATPTPSGIRSEGGMRQIFPPTGNMSYVTSHYPSAPPHLALNESPLAAKDRHSRMQKEKGCRILPGRNRSRDPTPDDAPIRPLIFDATPTLLPHLPKVSVDEERLDTINSSLAVTEQHPVVQGSDSNRTVDSLDSPSPITIDEQRMPVGVPDDILHWCNAPSPPIRARKMLTPEERRRKDASVEACLESFRNPKRSSMPYSRIIDHPTKGRMIQVQTQPDYEIDAIGLPSSTAPPYQAAYDPKQLKDLRKISDWLSRSDSETDSDTSVHGGQQGDAVTALRSIGSVRYWIQRRRSFKPAFESELEVQPELVRLEDATEARRAMSPLGSQRGDGTKSVDGAADDDGSNCICRGSQTSDEWVQCDGCETWHHVPCVSDGATAEEFAKKRFYCWRCPVPITPGRATSSAEPTFSLADSPVKKQYVADVPLYEGASQSPPKRSRFVSQPNSFSLFEPGSNHPFDKATPSPLHMYPSHPYALWSSSGENSRTTHDGFDDPMAAIASTPMSAASFMHTYHPYADLGFDNFGGSPSRSLGLHLTPFYPGYPRKSRPWTNYTGTFSTPTTSTDPSQNTINTQPLPAVPTDPLFIHYEHDAPKQTAHHQSSLTKGRKKGKATRSRKEREASDKTSEKAESTTVQDGATSEAGDTSAKDEGSVTDHHSRTPPSARNRDVSPSVQGDNVQT